MKITKKFLTKQNACQNGIDWAEEQNLIGLDRIKVIQALMKADKLDWANWLIVRVMVYKQYVSYAVYAAEQVIDIYEKKYPDDKRPRQAIEAARKCIDDPSEENKTAANVAAYATAYAANAAYVATNAAAKAAYTANVAYAADAAYAAYADIKIKILNYGIGLLRGS